TTFGPGGPAAPREVSHRSNVLPGQLLGELGALYQAFAYKPSSLEAPDHVAVEVGFIAYLRLKQAYAHERNDADQAAIATDAARRLIADHLRPLAEPLAKSLATSGILYLSQTASALLERIRLAAVQSSKLSDSVKSP
ncbi:MAG: molecular chaperone TorD family protein, partial [Verrucomicrobia bacterium]|nr:molecular chaperone TorD family protein [Verrucomicrobiota bacterium]